MATKRRTVTPKFFAEIVQKDGKNTVKLINTHYYQKYLDGAFKVGQQISITIKHNYRNRTTGRYDDGEKGNQNGYLYAVVLPMVSQWTGYSIDEAMDALETVLCKQGDNEHGLPKILRFKDMDTVEFNHYVIDAENPESVRSWVLRMSDGTVDIPEPDKNYKNRGYAPDSGDK